MAEMTAPAGRTGAVHAASRAEQSGHGRTGLPRHLDVDAIKRDFPILSRTVHGRRVVYLDSASSSQRPQLVLDAMDDYYRTTHANVHRGVYALAEEADRLYEAARITVGRFLGAPDPEHEVIFT